jgi:diguanylate cyclase (GGDEF)-like protein/PAS domain S-box-containing protein
MTPSNTDRGIWCFIAEYWLYAILACFAVATSLSSLSPLVRGSVMIILVLGTCIGIYRSRKKISRAAFFSPESELALSQSKHQEESGADSLDSSSLSLNCECLQLAIQTGSSVFWKIPPNSDSLYFSKQFFDMLGLPPLPDNTPYSLSTWFARVHPEDIAHTQEMIHALQTGQKSQMELIQRVRHYDGHYRYILVRSTALEVKDDSPYLCGSMTDLTAIREAETRLSEEKQHLKTLLSALTDAVITTDQHGFVKTMNPRAEKLTGWTAREARGKPVKDIFCIVSELSREALKTPSERTLESGDEINLTSHTLISKSGQDLQVEDIAVPIRNLHKKLIGTVLIFRDITDNRQLSRQISYQASHDELTTLFNRGEFERRLKIALITSRRSNTTHSMLYIDIDLFKIINDTCGHIAGDHMLRGIGPIIQELVPDTDIVARLGGDEFGVLLNDCHLDKAHQIANQIRSKIEENVFHWRNQSFVQTASIGVVKIDNEIDEVATILKRADSACFAAKDAGRNRIHIYREDDALMTTREGEMRWVSKLAQALEENRFVLYHQTIAPLSANEETGRHYEILLRLTDEKGDLVPPFIFLSAAERYNMIDKIDRWVVKNVFSWLHEHPQHLHELALCSINLSGKSMCDSDLLDYINEQFVTYQIPPHKICFEVTETMVVANIETATSLIEALKEKGCKFALDDFGTGMSSFSYLKNLPVDYLKIDGSFVKDILTDPIDSAMVNSINEIGHVMGKKTIAEFVENEQISIRLREIGVDFAQGYGIDFPTPLA